MADLQIGGKRVAMNHYPNIARALAASDSYDLVCYGHDHLAHDERIGSTRLFNPGELMGRLGASVFALYDLADGTFDRIEVLSDQAR
jgi:predicted phosphodiesterase